MNVHEDQEWQSTCYAFITNKEIILQDTTSYHFYHIPYLDPCQKKTS
jgi:hypothetical protein